MCLPTWHAMPGLCWAGQISLGGTVQVGAGSCLRCCCRMRCALRCQIMLQKAFPARELCDVACVLLIAVAEGRKLR